MSILHGTRIARFVQSINQHTKSLIDQVVDIFKTDSLLIGFLSVVALAAFGFELFNLHLTIDEEIHSRANQAEVWIMQGRWGMFLLSTFILPQPVLPFITLFVTLAFHLLAIVVLLHAWGIKSSFSKMTAGAIAMAYPGMTHIYMFSTINFGIGIGLFMIALATLLSGRKTVLKRLLAILPAAFALSIYQGLVIALIAAFVIKVIADILIGGGRRNIDWAEIGWQIVIFTSATFIYLLGQKLALELSGLSLSYIDSFYDFDYLLQAPIVVLGRLNDLVVNIYSGSPEIFGMTVRLFPAVILLSLVSLVFQITFAKLGITTKIFMTIAVLSIILLPFSLGLLMRGVIPLRALVSIPIILLGLVAIGTFNFGALFRLVAGLVISFTVFQFAVSTNSLFASSSLALEADKLTANRVLERIESARFESGGAQVKYLELVGYPSNSSTRLRPRSEVFGASFFEWDQGNVYRVLYFLSIFSDHDLEGLPPRERRYLVDQTQNMPSWPSQGSVKVFGNTVVVKFGDYSARQLMQMTVNP